MCPSSKAAGSYEGGRGFAGRVGQYERGQEGNENRAGGREWIVHGSIY